MLLKNNSMAHELINVITDNRRGDIYILKSILKG